MKPNCPTINKTPILTLPLLCLGLAAFAAGIPGPERVLPIDTLGVLTIPDMSKARVAYDDSPPGQLWRDSAMRPFRDKLMAKWKSDVVAPLEKELGIKLDDYASLAQGQMTLAIMAADWEGKLDKMPGILLLVDAKDKRDQLKKTLEVVRKKWTDSGKKTRADRIRDVEFTTLISSPQEITKSLEKALPGKSPEQKGDKPEPENADKGTGGEKIEITLGQYESLLIVGNRAKDIDRVLSRLGGGQVAALAEQETFSANHARMFRESLVYGWINFTPINDLIARQAAAASASGDDQPSLVPIPKPDKIVGALGLSGLKSLAFSVRSSADGALVEGLLGVPEAGRKGIFKLLSVEAKDAGPPPFVPADAVRFSRWRLDLQKTWANLEALLTDLVPQITGAITLLETAGKEKDPDFDLRKSLIGNLGDDIISYQKPPRGQTLEDLNSAPALALIGAPNAEKVQAALKALTALLPPQLMELKEREFLGRKIYSLPLPPMPGQDPGKPAQRNLSFAAGGGYLGLSVDDATLEEFLRGSENKPKPLAETAGLAEAAQKVGGMNTGLFGYDNTAEQMRALFETIRKEGMSLSRLLGASGNAIEIDEDTERKFKEWFDVSLLPSFDRIAKYFHFSVFAAGIGTDGYSYKIFAPTPVGLKK